MRPKTYRFLVVYAVVVVCIIVFLLMSGCGLIGSAAGGAVAGGSLAGPQGALAGGIGGVIGYGWTEIVNWWHGLWNTLTADPTQRIPQPSPGNPIVVWVIVALVAGFLFKLTWDSDFRAHVFGIFRTLPHVRRRRNQHGHAPSPGGES